ncbi:restriction endonuclease [Microtetraspora malaysiensis]|uniref:restriction endonuclease n=1 Tax=Microtetraspora malaysiensis TaxID=161358 RepID=UPI0012FCC8B9|nr:restriction endonuclease [Microtetraspora malaysiensis]
MPESFNTGEVEKDFSRLLNRKSGRGSYGYVLAEEPTVGESLSFDRYDPELLTQRDGLNDFGATRPLSELFTINVGPFFRANSKELVTDIDDPLAVRVVLGRDVSHGGLITPADEDSEYAHVPQDQQLAAGDILLRGITRLTDSGGLVVAEATEADLPAVASSNVLVLRPTAAMPSSQLSIVIQFLRTPLAKKLVLAGTDGLRISVRALGELPVPQLDDDLLAAWDSLESARTRFETWREEADSVLNSVFSSDSAEAARIRLIKSGRNLRLRSNAAASLDDPSYIFRTRFPYPIAYRWRLMEAAYSADAYRDAYVAALDTAEILACYTALLGLSLAREAGIEIGYVRNIREKLRKGKSGPSFGDWVAILREISTSRHIQPASDAKKLQDLRYMLGDKEADAALSMLASKRNDESHLRRVDPGDLPRACKEALAELTTLMNSALVLADLPLVQLTSVRWDSFRRVSTVQFRELMGDHPVVPSQYLEYASSELEVDSLYVLDEQHRLHLLRPYLIGSDCPKCHMWSTFHIEGVHQDRVKLKSLENGHTLDREGVAHVFRSVDFI